MDSQMQKSLLPTQQDIADSEKVQTYLEPEFQEYVKQNYPHEESESIYKNPQILKMIYAVEWFELPRVDYHSLVIYHPELTKGDVNKLDALDQEHYISAGVTFILTSLIANRVLLKQKQQFVQRFMQKRWLRTPCACLMGGLVTLAVNKTIMVPVYERDLKELGLSKYYQLDLEADLMRQDLKQMKIMRINELEQQIEASIKTAKESQKN